MMIIIIIIIIIACSEVRVLYFLRDRKRLVKPLLVPGWREQLQTILLGHKALGRASGTYTTTHLSTPLSFLCFSHQLANRIFCLLLLAPGTG